MCRFLPAGIFVLDFASTAPSAVKSIRQRDLLNTWLRLYARQQVAPAIWEYQPARLEEELSDLIYYTVDRSGPMPHLIIQSEGTRISRAYGHTGKGILLQDYVGPRLAPFVMPIYHECVARGLPVYSVADVDDIYGRNVAYERLLLPFLTDDKVSHVIASVKTFCEDGGFEIKNLMRGNDAPPRPRLRAVIDRDLFHRVPGRIAAADVVELADQSGPNVAAETIEPN
ncbi:PAS domain-containing protein [Bradyrhizobium liaoningense]|uniref:PAS domain-containing protein n=1 Tax=Bradyrhizobium liaoningense TaxID=43992 RepID=UPI001BA775D0|nr:PAS domain-containing protein [Bradyrhizobium liaoningense]